MATTTRNRGAKISATTTTETAGLPRIGGMADFGIRTMMYGLINMAKGLTEVPGRKTLVLFTSGFPLSAEMRSELTAEPSEGKRDAVGPPRSRRIWLRREDEGLIVEVGP